MNESTWNQDRRYVIDAIDRIGKTVEAIAHDLDGNGKPGLKDKVRALEEAAKIRKRVIAFLLTTMVTAGAGWLFTGGASKDGAKQEQHGKP